MLIYVCTVEFDTDLASFVSEVNLSYRLKTLKLKSHEVKDNRD